MTDQEHKARLEGNNYHQEYIAFMRANVSTAQSAYIIANEGKSFAPSSAVHATHQLWLALQEKLTEQGV